MIGVYGATKRLGDTTVVDDVDFEAPTGAITYLLGPNGTGKSTVMRMVAGLVRPDRGRILIDGAVAGRHRPGSLGVGFGPFSRHPAHTARAHLLWQARLTGLPASSADEALERVGLQSVRDRRVGGFSLGMAQRLSIASAVLGDPPTVLLDEPATGLDVDGLLWLRGLLADLSAGGTTVLVASHDLPEVEVTASRIVVLGRGRVLCDEARDDLLARATGPRPLESVYLDLTRDSVAYAQSTTTPAAAEDRTGETQ
ncbi:ABC transporter related protein OS=Tsukamurella paurometabola (strain ATCC 8368 / DSM / CCUG 35730 / CIP 100753 / JCM 10117 / KCTC 9821 / NBRC 16120 / NCIMB 702349 / NCTC 13040) OX=521096 GN=Tpau_4316 PE=4 SV=1 [Tsukamurella paurometabola]|uniref:ABC transporter related protein n=1 Tax=Tsukamurella paurometabola (strain ATCC 8368 / DSM 20162 / CCUG 35730 / CIP 100753 / JCM 10117 / KCTC 9821 / NBRC 16120 / NCIMB 702349 / NCTC 13040) TaxID=521096 RepID=D5UZ30_TSUPD|nr:ATP-binding cassette domain-containing protein [Tsukamurella paurometabola]ADG80877.1 ABC transporter related protein [Tsukamurella paurometabola DSM 20162]SUQ39243.1 Sulfate/thiosulfate import ATP-binding protein CysA [Tsukamurella paurometabola]